MAKEEKREGQNERTVESKGEFEGKGWKRKIPHRHGKRFEGGSAESGTDMGPNRMSRGKELRKGKEDGARGRRGRNGDGFILEVEVGR